MNNKNCQLCKNYKDGYCKELELKPSYPEKGCDYFTRQNRFKKDTMPDLEACEDVISRQAVLNEAFEVDTKDYGRIDVVGVDAIDALPPVTPQPKVGHWIDTDEGFSPCKCSECETVEFKKSKYCPNCGCYMVEPQESEDRE